SRHPDQLLARHADPQQPRRGRPHRARLPAGGKDRPLKALRPGAFGQLGREIVALLGPEAAWSGGRAELDVARPEGVDALVERVLPDVVFNCAAYNQVDRAESEPGLALEVNALGPLVLARAARKVGALLVHFSTDYVFDGCASRPLPEDDPPPPPGGDCGAKLAAD